MFTKKKREVPFQTRLCFNDTNKVNGVAPLLHRYWMVDPLQKAKLEHKNLITYVALSSSTQLKMSCTFNECLAVEIVNLPYNR